MVFIGSKNWIKINRSIWDCFLWDFKNPKYAMCWIDMLLMANYKDKKILFDGKAEVIPRGSFITSMVKLAERWKVDRATVKRLLNLLQDDGMITYTCNNKRTLITIVKYDVYQNFMGDDATAESTTDATADPTADTTQHKNIKEYKEDKKKDITKVISKEKATRFIPPTVEEVRVYCLEKGYKVDAEQFVDFYASKGWMVGKNKMEDWKASVRTWTRSKRQESTANANKNNSFNDFEQRQYDYNELERMLIQKST